MTYYLLLWLGIIWCVLIYVLARFISTHFSSNIRQQYVKVIALLFAVAPVLYEYWIYIDFRGKCVGNSGFVRLNPVLVDTLFIDAHFNGRYEFLIAHKLKHLSIYDDKDGWLGWHANLSSYSDLSKIPICQNTESIFKGVTNLSKRITSSYQCLTHYEPTEAPLYEVTTGFYHSFDDYGWPVTKNKMYMDFNILLSNKNTNEVLTEYRGVSTPAGPIIDVISQWRPIRYSCAERTLGKQSYPANYLLRNFIDAAIVQQDS